MSFTWITLHEIWVQNDRNRYELLMIMSMFIRNLKPVTDSLPAVLWWAGTGLESVWSWEHRSGSCPVPAFCGISMGHYHVLRFWIYPTVLQGQYMSICNFKCLSPILWVSNVAKYGIHHCSYWGRSQIRIWTHKMNPISHPDGQTMGCSCKDFEENWPRYKGTALYVSLNWVMVINCSGNGLWPVYRQPITWLNTNQLV